VSKFSNFLPQFFRPDALRPTFVFAQWWAFENVFVPRDQTLNEDKNL
jgi:hypothetical protein